MNQTACLLKIKGRIYQPVVPADVQPGDVVEYNDRGRRWRRVRKATTRRNGSIKLGVDDYGGKLRWIELTAVKSAWRWHKLEA